MVARGPVAVGALALVAAVTTATVPVGGAAVGPAAATTVVAAGAAGPPTAVAAGAAAAAPGAVAPTPTAARGGPGPPTAVAAGEVATTTVVGAAGAGPKSAVAADEPPSRASTATAAAERPTWTPGNRTDLPADSTKIEIAVRPDGTAEWTVRHRVQLDDAGTEARFERVNRTIADHPLNYTGPFKERMETAASLAADETGRAMEIRNADVRARELPTGEGVVTYTCVWTGFAAASDGRLEIGDALVGFDLSSGQLSLVIQWPAGYEPASVIPEPDRTSDRAAVWRGPTEFAPAEPRVVATGGGPLPVPPVVAAVAAAAVVAGAGVGWRLRAGGAAAGDGTGVDESDAGPGDDDGEEVPEELLSDAERVLRLVEDNGGRMKQQDVVAAMDWSETKTSQVVNDLQDDDALEIYTIGRENVLSLPGEMDV